MPNRPLEAANANDLPSPGILDMRGNPYVPPRATNEQSNPLGAGSGGGGFGDHAVNIAKLQQSVEWLWKAVGSIFVLGLGAIVASYLLLANRVDDRYDKIGDKLDHIVQQISDLRVAVTQDSDQHGRTQTGARKG